LRTPPIYPFASRADDVDQRSVFVELRAHLVEVGDGNVGAQARRAAVRLQFTQDEFEQRGLARAIGSDDADAVAAKQGGGIVVHDDLVAEALADVLQFRHEFAGTLALGQRQRHIAHALAARGALHAQAFQAAHTAFIAGAAGFHALADPDFFLRQELVETCLLKTFGLEPLGLTLLPLRKVARKAEQASAIEFDDAGGDSVEEAAIVGDDDGGALPGAQHVFQPGDAFKVQMVGGFVEQQQIWFVDQGAGEGDALARAAR